MRIAEINMYSSFSTGKIMLGIAQCTREASHEIKTFSPRTYARGIKKEYPSIEGHCYFGSDFEAMVHSYAGKITGFNGFFSYFATEELIENLKIFKPNIVHIHNIHDFCINFPLLFGYLKKNKIKTVWTLHDCWSFTGHCPHFVMAKCSKWETGCYDCPQLSVYPKTLIDNTRYMWKKKKELFSGLDMTLVTPSVWLKALTETSYMNQYPVKVINNGIDLNVFKPMKNDIRRKYSCENKYILLGVAATWGERKGLDVFKELADRLNDDYRIILVGTDETVDKELPENIISVHRTQNQQELAEIYTVADLFVNPTREDVFPTVNLEALACGTPVLTFNTGGSPESLDDTCGRVVPCDDKEALLKEIINICENKLFTEEACIEKARKYDMRDRYREYVKLYEDFTHCAQ